MYLFCATIIKYLIKPLFLLVCIYICTSSIVFAAKDILSAITQPSNMKAVEQCVADVNYYQSDALDTAERLYQTSVCYICAGCDLGSDNGHMFEGNQASNFVLDNSYTTAFRLMQQAVELGSRQANYGLAILIYVNDLSENKLTKVKIATKMVGEYIDALDSDEKVTQDEIDKNTEEVIKQVNSKQHELDFKAEIHLRLLSAAQAGYMPSQFALSEVYARGIGVAQNKVNAYAWAATAVAQNPPFGSVRRDSQALEMDSFELNEAEFLAEYFMKRYTDIFDRSSITVMR